MTNTKPYPQNESTPRYPRSQEAASKHYGVKRALAGVAFLGAGYLAAQTGINFIRSVNSSYYNPNASVADEAIAQAEQGNPKAADFGLLLRSGVKMRATPGFPKVNGEEVTDNNVQGTVKEPSIIIAPLEVSVKEANDSYSTWYGFPTREATAEKPLEKSDYVWVSSDVIGQRANNNDELFAEIVYPSTESDTGELQSSPMIALGDRDPQQLVDQNIRPTQ